jgi:hypothetical protein
MSNETMVLFVDYPVRDPSTISDEYLIVLTIASTWMCDLTPLPDGNMQIGDSSAYRQEN